LLDAHTIHLKDHRGPRAA